MPVNSTPSALYAPIKLSPADEQVYQKALNDIPLYRQGDLQIIIQDDSGNPLSGYQIKYHQASHDFLFGGIADSFQIGKLHDAGINTMTVYMAANWIEPEYGKYDLEFTNYWLGIDELKSGSIRIKTNDLFNPGNEMSPYWSDLSYDEFQKRLYEHVSTTVKRFAPSVDFWEAILEPDAIKTNPLNLTKDEYYQAIATSIKAIRENDPTAKVEISLGIPCGGFDWLDSYQTLQEMVERNLDFDVVGLQYYYNAYIAAGNYPMPKMSFSEMSACYDKYGALLTPHGKKIVGSEFSVPSEAPAGQMGYWNTLWSEDTQAQYLDTAYTIFFSKPSNLGLIWWNTVDPSPFVYNGGIISDGGTPKKSYYALERLIEDWTTTGETITDNSGAVSFRGFGGDYEIEIVNPASGEKMLTQVHVTEQKSTNETIIFQPNKQLLEQKTKLEKLVGYWESKSEVEFVSNGHDYLALVNHHLQNAEWTMAEQTISTALDELVITTELNIPVSKFSIASQGTDLPIIDNGRVVIWGSDTLYYPYDFPHGTVSVEIKAHAQSEKGELPFMNSGVGANYSEMWKVENTQPEVYSFTVATTGREKVFTIRFPYDGRIYHRITAQNGNVGELKLYIDEVKLVIKTAEVP